MSVRSLIEGSTINQTIQAGVISTRDARVTALKCDTITSDNSTIVCNKTLATVGHYVTGSGGHFPWTVTGANAISSTTIRGETITNDPVAVVIGLDGTVGVGASTRETKMNLDYSFPVSPLMSLKPVKFQYRKKDGNGGYLNVPEGHAHYGFIADEVASVIPEMIVKYGEKTVGVDKDEVIAILVKAVQEQSVVISAMRQKLGL